jgi:hypothetical protein
VWFFVLLFSDLVLCHTFPDIISQVLKNLILIAQSSWKIKLFVSKENHHKNGSVKVADDIHEVSNRKAEWQVREFHEIV